MGSWVIKNPYSTVKFCAFRFRFWPPLTWSPTARPWAAPPAPPPDTAETHVNLTSNISLGLVLIYVFHNLYIKSGGAGGRCWSLVFLPSGLLPVKAASNHPFQQKHHLHSPEEGNPREEYFPYFIDIEICADCWVNWSDKSSIDMAATPTEIWKR